MIDQYNRYHFENNFFGNPKTCGALSVYQLGEMHCCPTTVVSPHCQQCYELTYVLSGKGKTVTNGTETVLSPGDCSVNFPGDTHSIVSDRENPLRYAFCGFMPDPGDRVWSMIIAELHRLFDGKNERIFRMKDENNVFYDIFTEINSDDFMSGEFISASLERFLILLIRTGRKEPETFYSSNIKSETMLTYQIQQYLMHHVCEIRKLTELESLFNYNYRYITKCFRKIAGETLGDYHTKCRMNVACKLLTEGQTVTQISRILNYSSIHVFTRSFRNYFGMTPSEYRRSRRTASESAVEVPGKTKDKDRNHENRDL